MCIRDRYIPAPRASRTRGGGAHLGGERGREEAVLRLGDAKGEMRGVQGDVVGEVLLLAEAHRTHVPQTLNTNNITS
eukprot:149994-Prorocentrum_minimum.AAC.6